MIVSEGAPPGQASHEAAAEARPASAEGEEETRAAEGNGDAPPSGEDADGDAGEEKANEGDGQNRGWWKQSKVSVWENGWARGDPARCGIDGVV